MISFFKSSKIYPAFTESQTFCWTPVKTEPNPRDGVSNFIEFKIKRGKKQVNKCLFYTCGLYMSQKLVKSPNVHCS